VVGAELGTGIGRMIPWRFFAWVKRGKARGGARAAAVLRCDTRPMKKFVLALVIALGAHSALAEAPVPLLWKVSDADNSLYLLGSFHMLKPTDYPVAKSVDAAFEDAKQLYFELSPQEMSDPTLGEKLAQAGARTDGTTLQQSVSAKTWRKLQAYAAKNNMSAANFQSLKPWFVGLILAITELQKNGLDTSLGLDQHFMQRAALAGKPTYGLETGDAQIALFNGLSPKQQDQLLEEALDTGAKMKSEIQALHTAWRTADDKKLYQDTALKMRREYPDLYLSLNLGRNLAWLPKLETLLRDNPRDNILVVVGAMHLVGEDGVVKMLANKGYKVQRLK
jgi:uncharacterized protein